MIRIKELHPLEVPDFSARIAPILAPAVARSNGRMLVEDVLRDAEKQRGVLLLAMSGQRILGVVYAYPVQYARRRGLFVLFISGRRGRLWQAAMEESTETLARRLGCDMIEGVGRRGWTRVLKGYRVGGTLYEKDLT